MGNKQYFENLISLKGERQLDHKMYADLVNSGKATKEETLIFYKSIITMFCTDTEKGQKLIIDTLKTICDLEKEIEQEKINKRIDEHVQELKKTKNKK